LEELERRDVPSGGPLQPYGGPIIPHVQISALFLGQEWQTDSQLNSYGRSLLQYLQFLPQSSYMTQLLGPYGVGLGSLTSTNIYFPNPPSTLKDQQIENVLANGIIPGYIPGPNPDRFYIVFVPPGVNVIMQNGEVAGQNQKALAYHYGFVLGNNQIRYAVIPVDTDANLNAFQTATVAISHELSEGVTDPWHTAWHTQSGDEIGDLAAGFGAFYNGYLVQAEWSNALNGPAIPAGTQLVTWGSPGGGGNSLDVTLTPSGSFTPISSGYGTDAGFQNGLSQTATQLNVSATSVPLGQSVTLTAKVTPPPSGSPSTVTFFDGSTNLGTVAVGSDGTATLTTTNLHQGDNSLTAKYNGDATFGPSTSSAIDVVVTSSPQFPPATPWQLFLDGIFLAIDLSEPGGFSTAMANAGLMHDIKTAQGGLFNPYLDAGFAAVESMLQRNTQS
jgi:hypothetical protein